MVAERVATTSTDTSELAPELKKTFLLLASRNAYKSSFSLIWLLTAVLCCPDIRALLISETKNLSKGFIRGFRNYWEVSNKSNPTRFQTVFPEYCVPVGEGSTLTFESPMAHLGLIQSVESTSMDSTVAGSRADLICFDDPISNVTCGTEEQRQSSIFKYALILKLGEVGSIVTCLGTPWHPEDAYSKIIERAKEDDSIDIRIDPAWVLKPEARMKPLKDVTEDDVESFLFEERLSFKFLKRELKSSGEKFFRSQNLVEFTPDDEDLLKCQFDEATIRHFTKPRLFYQNLPLVTSVLSLDQSYSISRFADLSCCLYGEVRRMGGKNIFVVVDVMLDRLRMSELSLQVVLMIQRNNPQRVIIERTGAYESLAEQINRHAVIRGISLPHIYWKPTTGGQGSITNKAGRIKGTLEPLLEEGRLYHVSAQWNDAAILQLVKFDGVTKSSMYRKDDYPDALERAVSHSGINTPVEKAVVDAQTEEEERLDTMRRLQHQAMFGQGAAGWVGKGSDWAAPPAKPPEPETTPARPTDPRMRFLPTGMRL